MKLAAVLLLAALRLGWSQLVSNMADVDALCAKNAAVCRHYGLRVARLPIKAKTLELASANQEDQSNLLRCALAAGVSPNFIVVQNGTLTTPLVRLALRNTIALLLCSRTMPASACTAPAAHACA
jgi:hypothetical protein